VVQPEVKTFSNEATMQFSVDGLNYVGMAAIPRKLKQSLRFTLPKTAERIVVSTCHGAPVFISPANPFSFTYEPVHLIEDTATLCILKAEVASKESPLSLAVIDFFGDEVTMPAWVTCNRNSLRTGGGSVCQAPAGLIQRIVFDESVIAQPYDKGEISCDGAACTYTMTKGYNGYIFRGVKTGSYHRHTTRGTAAMEN
jgi:hypothetical protein